ncbi:crotonobetainyl-CoA:carnitine CoA-transferase CaiB-like acyl-CoA transferase [Mycobacterium sp. OAS707]|uniref:CaiB/BaiF CoA transferase family protein n=1 Tax=Mycobacterium sp. OAS707 TaxID=2663822 RepID=UPI001789420A|nr:CoA transferase [Mycobacterium sp. OAS707]MBE1551930.1 crotonobetainyl-CoA:carnitine CoA-transferase CaiB-like acyl-CoA transferase [Mycobacterium sp. OAS707]
MESICAGINVVELGSGSIAASIAGVVLADAGARVIKVEPPDGDRLRTHNPSGFLVWNRGKESLVADLHTADGQQTVRDLAAHADVVIEGFAPGRTSAWGIGANDLRAANPALIHCAVTGFGTSGPYAGLKAYDSLVAAKVGLWARGAFGHRDGPIMFPVPWGSFGAGMQSVAGIIGALMVREKTGRGQTLGATLVAGLDPIDYFVTTVVQVMAKRGEKPNADARAATAASRFGVLLVTRDGRFVQTSTMLPHQGRALCEVAGVGSCLEDPRFQALPTFANADDAQEWEELLQEAFRAKDLDHWLPLLEASPNVAFEVAVTSEEGLTHPQIVHNGDVVTVHDAALGPVRQVGPVGHFDKTPIGPTRSAPALDENAGPLIAHDFPAGGSAAPNHAFDGITVVEFGCFYAMPYATAILASLGARVIKIEDGNGDPHRNSFGPEVASTKTTAGKESLSVDLRTAEGRAVAQQVVANADAFVNGFRSGVAEKLGLGYEELSELNPRLFYVHAAGYGTDGPYAHRALYAQAAQTVAGSFGRQVGYWMDPAQSEGFSVMELQAVVLPRLNMLVDGDSNAALVLLAALSLGLYGTQKTGVGQFMRTSMIGTNAWAYSDDFCSYQGKPPIPLCDSEYYGTAPLDRVYPASGDGWVCLSVRTDDEFAALRQALELPEVAADDAQLESLLAGRFIQRPAADWESALTAAGVGCVEVNMKGQPIFTAYDPILRETGLTVVDQHPVFGEMVRAAPPVTFSETPGRVAPSCLRGQHNRTILAELGYSDGDIAKLEELEAVIPPASS